MILRRPVGPDSYDEGWLVRDGTVLASIEIPLTHRARARGLTGRSSHEGAMLLKPARSVHSWGMRFTLDVAFIDADDVVIRMLQLHPHRVTLPVFRARSVLEAEVGSFRHWELNIGDKIEIRR